VAHTTYFASALLGSRPEPFPSPRAFYCPEPIVYDTQKSGHAIPRQRPQKHTFAPTPRKRPPRNHPGTIAPREATQGLRDIEGFRKHSRSAFLLLAFLSLLSQYIDVIERFYVCAPRKYTEVSSSKKVY